MEDFFIIFMPITFYILQSRILKFRFKSVFYFPVYTFFYILLIVQGKISTWMPQAPLKFLLICITILFPIFFYKDSLTKRVTWTVVPYTVYSVLEFFVLFSTSIIFRISLNEILNNETYRTSLTLISGILFLFIAELYLHLFHKKSMNLEEFKKEFLILLGIDLFFIMVITGLFGFNSTFISPETALWIMVICLMAMSTCTILIIYKITQKSREISDTKLQLQQQEMEYQLTESLEDVTSNLRNLRHDMNNHFGILQGLLNLQEYDEACSYLKTIMNDLEVANQFTFVDNKMLSVLINTKISKASSLNIPMETEILTNEFPMDDRDLISLVGNILENAIEASSQCEKPSIQFTMKKEGAHCIILCNNTFSEKPILQDGNFVTTKENKALHGIGTKIIKSTTEKYHGTVKFEVTDIFQTVVSIPY